MEKELLDRVATNHMKCSKCGLVIPFVFKKGARVHLPELYHC